MDGAAVVWEGYVFPDGIHIREMPLANAITLGAMIALMLDQGKYAVEQVIEGDGHSAVRLYAMNTPSGSPEWEDILKLKPVLQSCNVMLYFRLTLEDVIAAQDDTDEYSYIPLQPRPRHHLWDRITRVWRAS